MWFRTDSGTGSGETAVVGSGEKTAVGLGPSSGLTVDSDMGPGREERDTMRQPWEDVWLLSTHL